MDGWLDPIYCKTNAASFNQETKKSYFVFVNTISSIDTELLVINRALTNWLSYEGKVIYVLTDSKYTLQTSHKVLQQLVTHSGSWRFKILLQKQQERNNQILFQWIPPHCSVVMNEMADVTTRSGRCDCNVTELTSAVFTILLQKNWYYGTAGGGDGKMVRTNY